MDLSDPATPQASSSPNGATSTRRSGRAKHKPVLLQTDPNASIVANGSGKRKRDANSEEVDVDIVGSESSDLDESNGDPDEEELKEKRRKSRSKKPTTRPAAKKPKTAVSKTTSLPVRPATNGVKKPSKPRQPRAKPTAVIDDDGTGLFCKLTYASLLVDTRLLTCLSSPDFLTRPYSECRRIRVDYAIRPAQCECHV